MVTLIIISLILVVLYVSATIYHTHSIPDSVSAMVYALPTSGRYIWTVWLWAVSMLRMPTLMEKLGSYWQFLGFLWCASMAFCGALPLVKGEPNTIHNSLGVAAGIISQAIVFILNPWWMCVWLLLSWFVLTDKVRDLTSVWYGKTCFLAESVCYVSLVGCLLTT
jgi:hypothetical protein